MKKRISITVDEEVDEKLQKILDKDRGNDYRNKSHIVEKAIKYFLEVKNGKGK
jgi:metal-responsive CopG/Arc/MetJ family transcriptional regulator